MKKIAYLFVAAMAVLSFTGCKKKSEAAEAIKKMEALKTDMCKCTDKACAEKVQKQMEEWEKSMTPEKAEKMLKDMTADDKKKGDEIEKAYKDCMNKQMGAGTMTPPAGDGSAAATPPPAGDEKKMDGSAAAPAGDEKKMDDKAAAPAGDEKKPEDKKM